MKRTLPLMLGVVCFLVANDEIPQRIKVSKTEHADLLPGSTLRLKNSTGEVTVEGWDQPVVEITTIKSTKLAYSGATPAVERDRAAHNLENVKITFSQQNGEFVVTTDFPRGRRYLPRPSVGSRDFNLEYRIKVPRDSKIFVEHDEGEVHFDGLTGDISATTNQGAIILRLPSTAQYAIDAKVRIGDVTSEFPGTTTREHLGHYFVQTAPAPHKLFLRNGYGDILILRSHTAGTW